MRYLKKQSTNQSSLNGRGIKYSADEQASIDSTSSLLLPKGTTGQRGYNVEGMIRYNTTTQNFEAYEANPAFGTPDWKRFRTDAPKLITAQNLGNGDNVEHLFGALDANDPVTPVPQFPAQILVLVENVLQIPTTNYIFIQNPCYYNSAQMAYFVDFSIAGKPTSGSYAANTSAIFSNNVGIVDFEDAGFYDGQIIFVSGTTSNNGYYTIASVTPTVLEINETFPANENDPGYASVSTVEGLVNITHDTGTYSATTTGTNRVTLASTAGLAINQMIMFDTALGNIVTTQIYFVLSIPNATQITISATAGGSPVALTTAAGAGNYAAGFGYGRTPSATSVASQTFAAESLAVTAATGTGATATLTFAAQANAPFYVGQTITVGGMTPAGYNDASATVTACTVSTVSYANATAAPGTAFGIVTSVGNEITLVSTSNMAVGQEISFNGTNFGNLVDGTAYFIHSIPNATTLRISATYGGAVFTLTRSSGYMLVATLGNNLYLYFGTPVPSGKPVTVLHNFDK